MAAELTDTKLNEFYKSFMTALPVGDISYSPIETEKKGLSDMAAQISEYLRPYVNQSIKDVRYGTVQQKAALDADSASRGMSESTYLSDMKNRLDQSEQASISDLESNFGANLAQQVSEQYQNQLNRVLSVDTQNAANRLEVDKWNAQAKIALEQLAYARALEEYARTGVGAGVASGGSGSGSGSGGGLVKIDGTGIAASGIGRALESGPAGTGVLPAGAAGAIGSVPVGTGVVSAAAADAIRAIGKTVPTAYSGKQKSSAGNMVNELR